MYMFKWVQTTEVICWLEDAWLSKARACDSRLGQKALAAIFQAGILTILE